MQPARRIILATLVALCSGFVVHLAQAQDYDLVILNGRVMDPESGLDAVRNIGIKDGKILDITATKIKGKETVNAKGHVVAPGFIDLHVHGQDPYAVKLMLRDGVTSPLEIEAGAWPVTDYYDEREDKSQANYGVSVGHVWARLEAMDGVDPHGLGLYSGVINATVKDGSKWSTQRSDSDQMQAILAKVEQGLRDGGLGISFPVGYYTAVGSPEVKTVAALANRYNAFITTHVRYLAQIPPSGYLGVEELLSVALANEVPLIVHHVPSNCLALTPDCLDLIERVQKAGHKVAGEFYPYTAGSSIIGADYLGLGFQERTGMDYKDITYVKTGETMTKELLAKYRKEDPGALMIMRHIKEKDMLAAFKREGVFVGSDGVPFTDDKGGIPTWDAPYGVGNGHPRGAGTHAKVLRMVREQNVIPLMEAMAKLSYLQAKFLEDMVPDMKDRGRIKPGAVADITIFDPATVTDNATFEAGKNSLPSTGIPYVIVNGRIVVKDSKVLKGVYPGQPIRNDVLDGLGDT
ncbi:MAG: amidohydrolase family protein [Gammaproteobacteria bacterium]|nr:amidohydrolase family protein [Gammaproteobacteria bacterium]